MKEHEAHNYLEDFQREMTRHRQAYSEDLIEANGQAILALEKQMPKKVKISLHGTTDWNTKCQCNVCGKDLFDGQKYCSHCGQKIDWGKGE